LEIFRVYRVTDRRKLAKAFFLGGNKYSIIQLELLIRVTTLCPYKNGPPTDGDNFCQNLTDFQTSFTVEKRGVNCKQKPYNNIIPPYPKYVQNSVAGSRQSTHNIYQSRSDDGHVGQLPRKRRQNQSTIRGARSALLRMISTGKTAASFRQN